MARMHLAVLALLPAVHCAATFASPGWDGDFHRFFGNSEFCHTCGASTPSCSYLCSGGGTEGLDRGCYEGTEVGGVFRPNTEEPCYTGQYTFANTSAETARWDLSVPRAQVEGRMSPNPYRAFAYLQFCEGKPMSSCWAGAAGAAGGAGGAGGDQSRVFTFAFRTTDMAPWDYYTRLLSWSDGAEAGRILGLLPEGAAEAVDIKRLEAGGGGAGPAGHTPAKESSGAYNLVAFPTDNRPSSWRASTILQDGVWYNITAVVAPVANATHRGTGVKVLLNGALFYDMPFLPVDVLASTKGPSLGAMAFDDARPNGGKVGDPAKAVLSFKDACLRSVGGKCVCDATTTNMGVDGLQTGLGAGTRHTGYVDALCLPGYTAGARNTKGLVCMEGTWMSKAGITCDPKPCKETSDNVGVAGLAFPLGSFTTPHGGSTGAKPINAGFTCVGSLQCALGVWLPGTAACTPIGGGAPSPAAPSPAAPFPATPSPAMPSKPPGGAGGAGGPSPGTTSGSTGVKDPCLRGGAVGVGTGGCPDGDGGPGEAGRLSPSPGRGGPYRPALDAGMIVLLGIVAFIVGFIIFAVVACCLRRHCFPPATLAQREWDSDPSHLELKKMQKLIRTNFHHHHYRDKLIHLLDTSDGGEGPHTVDELMDLPSEDILLRWINYNLEQAGSDRRCTNFAEDLQDSEIYTLLMNQMSPLLCGLQALSFGNERGRAQAVVDNSTKIGVDPAVQVGDIVGGDAKKNVAFCTQLFNLMFGERGEYQKPRPEGPVKFEEPRSPAGNGGKAALGMFSEANTLWTRCMDDASRQSFYFNSDTGETSWTHPDASDEDKRRKEQALAAAKRGKGGETKEGAGEAMVSSTVNPLASRPKGRRRGHQARPKNKRRSLLYFPGWNKPKTPRTKKGQETLSDDL